MTEVMEIQEESKNEAYFTPLTVAEFMIENSQVRRDARIIDPSAGQGVFIENLLSRGYRTVWGIELEETLVSELRARLGASNGVHLLVGDALDPGTLGRWSMGTFDVAIGNPPFSACRSMIDDQDLLSNFELSRPKQAVEVLFLERFVQLVRPSGLVRTILPTNIFANTNLQYVRDFILENLWVEAVVSLPRHTFGGTSAKTVILFGQKKGRNWRVRGTFWEQKGVRLIEVPDLKAVAELPSLSIYDQDVGMQVSMADIAHRMDPGYHFASAELSKMLDGANVPFERLGALAELRTGYAKYGDKGDMITSAPAKDCNGGCVRLIKAKNLSSYGFAFGTHDAFIRTDQEVFRTWASAGVGDVLVVRVGAGCIGRAVCVTEDVYSGQADDWMFIVKPRKVNPSFLAFYLNSSIGKAFVLKEAHGTGAVSISKGKLQKVQVPVLPEPEQAVFEKDLGRMYESFRLGNQAEAEATFEAMEQRLKRLVYGD